jgi:hypothetical protein
MGHVLDTHLGTQISAHATLEADRDDITRSLLHGLRSPRWRRGWLLYNTHYLGIYAVLSLAVGLGSWTAQTHTTTSMVSFAYYCSGHGKHTTHSVPLDLWISIRFRSRNSRFRLRLSSVVAHTPTDNLHRLVCSQTRLQR